MIFAFQISSAKLKPCQNRPPFAPAPFAALRAFEAAARLGSFKLAAEELSGHTCSGQSSNHRFGRVSWRHTLYTFESSSRTQQDWARTRARSR